MHHKAIRLINATGGPGVVKAALSVGKKAICAGPGNPPAIVDETADLDNAARCIVEGTGFDNNVLCIGEKATFVVQEKADALIEKMRANGAYLAQGNEAARLIEYLIKDGHPNKDAVGKNASWILRQIGVSVSEETPIVMLEVPEDHPLILEEQLMPVMPIARVRDFAHATAAAFRCEGGRGHTLVIHSRDINRITAVRNAYQCTVFVANGSAAAAEGVGGEGWVAMSLAGHTGEGFTSPLTFVKKRRSTFAGSLGTGGAL
jgi:propionaldehyde dehydrogenase